VLAATVQVVHRTLEPPLRFAIVDAHLDEQLADHEGLLGEMVDVEIRTSRPSNR